MGFFCGKFCGGFEYFWLKFENLILGIFVLDLFLFFLRDFERVVVSRRPSRWLELVAWPTRSKILFFLRFVSLVAVCSIRSKNVVAL